MFLNYKINLISEKNTWLKLNIKYYGYNTLPEGASLFKEITSQLNNFRLSNNLKFNNNIENKSYLEFNTKYKKLLETPSPYGVENGIRFYRGNLKLVSDKVKFLSIDTLNNKTIYSSITKCSQDLKLDRAKIKSCLITGEIYKKYKFQFIHTSYEEIN